MKKIILVASIWLASHAFGAFGYYRSGHNNIGQVPSIRPIPFLISVTSARLKTVANGDMFKLPRRTIFVLTQTARLLQQSQDTKKFFIVLLLYSRNVASRV